MLVALLLACATADTSPPEDTDPTGDTDTGTGADTDTDTDTATDTDPPSEPELWFYVSYNLQTTEGVDAVVALLDRASAAGYHGMVLADFKLHFLHTDILPDWYDPNLQAVLDHAASVGIDVVPAVAPFGYSEGILFEDHDLAEGRPVTARFVARGGRLEVLDGYAGLRDGGFEAHDGDRFSGWSWQDDRVKADTAVFRSGASAARIDAGSGNARIVQSTTLAPGRQYRLSWSMKTADTWGYPQVIVLNDAGGALLNLNTLSAAATQDWTRYDIAFDSGDATNVSVYVGVWGEMGGTVWFDDVSLQETALVNLIRREGAPLTITGADGTEYAEPADVAPIVDPGTFDDWHEPPVPMLPEGSRIAEGDEVTLRHFVVQPIYGYQVGACLSEPAVDEWVDANLAAVSARFPAANGVMLGYDEMRHLNTCDACGARGLDAGALLAAHVADTQERVRAAWPHARTYVWSDMFDPYHNARAGYYLVEGDLTGSWAGLDPETIVMNWHIGNANSAQFFADRGFEQILAGYYDSGDGTTSAVDELSAASGVPGLRGLMYTTWASDWTQLEAYAESARAAWPR